MVPAISPMGHARLYIIHLYVYINHIPIRPSEVGYEVWVEGGNSNRLNFDFTPVPLRFHFDFSSMSLRCYFDFTSLWLRYHFAADCFDITRGGGLTGRGLGLEERKRREEKMVD